MSLLNTLIRFLTRKAQSAVVNKVIEKKMEKVMVNAQIRGFLSSVLQILLLEDEAQSAASLVPFLHKSLLSQDGKTLNASVRDFGFKKDRGNAVFYKVPVDVVKTEKVQEGLNGEEGTVWKYFIARKDENTGMPAPMKIFVPKDTSEQPKICYLGNL